MKACIELALEVARLKVKIILRQKLPNKGDYIQSNKVDEKEPQARPKHTFKVVFMRGLAAKDSPHPKTMVCQAGRESLV